MTVMEFTYRKIDTKELFNSAEADSGIGVTNMQNYIPLYETFFTLSNTNYDQISLNNYNKLARVNNKVDDNVFKCMVDMQDSSVNELDVFFKYSPLLDPRKYILGKYDIENEDLLKLPEYGNTSSHAKVRDYNNSAYVDGFFTYLTSQLLYTHNFVHALDFYGSYLAIKNDYADHIFNFDSRNNKNRLVFTDLKSDADIPLSSITDDQSLDVMLDSLDKLFVSPPTTGVLGEVVETTVCDMITDGDANFESKTNTPLNLTNSYNKTSTLEESDVSSRSSITNEEITSEDDESMTNDTLSTASEDVLFATIPTFPVQVIALEKCENTLDYRIINCKEPIKDAEWGSIIMQVLMTLQTFQITYKLTHNDLHACNIMYVTTNIPFLYYKYNNKHYKVPTYGRIYKIIDFGRAIYKFRGNVICSDSYHKKGEAATQYNFEPFYDSKKNRIEPNLSFDLCRLGCGLFDVIADELEENPLAPNNAAKKIIHDWCMDDNNKNILYKTNGEERYPGFKLYKMIARLVHNHTPAKELENIYFDRYLISKSKIKTHTSVMNIDDLPTYT